MENPIPLVPLGDPNLNSEQSESNKGGNTPMNDDHDLNDQSDIQVPPVVIENKKNNEQPVSTIPPEEIKNEEYNDQPDIQVPPVGIENKKDNYEPISQVPPVEIQNEEDNDQPCDSVPFVEIKNEEDNDQPSFQASPVAIQNEDDFDFKDYSNCSILMVRAKQRLCIFDPVSQN